jgi:flagellar biosynthesis chaperone FliJ
MLMEDRKTELHKLLECLDEAPKKVLEKVVDEVIYIETRLDELKKLPQIKVNPNNPGQQKYTVAAKQYKEYLQQYNNCIKILLHAVNHTESEEVSPLREYLMKMRDKT